MSHSPLRIASLLGASAAVLALTITPAAHADQANPHTAPPTSQGKHLGQGKSHGSSAHHVRSSSPGRSGQAPGRSHGNPSPGSPPTQAPGQQSTTSGQQPTGGASGDPAGNNGTVKISLLGDHDGTPNNVPHPGCTFEVQWYGYDVGSDIVSTVAFTPQAPTAGVTIGVSGPAQVQVGGDPASGAGTPTGLDAVQDYVLSFSGAAPAKQGYHVRVTVSTPHSLGNDTKTKVFWVEPCTPAPAPGGGTTPSAGQPQPAGTVASPFPETVTLAGSSPVRGGASAGRIVSAGVPTVVDAGMARAGGYLRTHSPWPLAVAGLGMMLTAVGVARMRRRA